MDKLSGPIEERMDAYLKTIPGTDDGLYRNIMRQVVIERALDRYFDFMEKDQLTVPKPIISFYSPITSQIEQAEVKTDKRDALIRDGHKNADSILNTLHQAGWSIIPTAVLKAIK